MKNRTFNIVCATLIFIGSLISIDGCKTATASTPSAPAINTTVKVLTDVSIGLNTASTLVTSLNSTGVITTAQYKTISNDLLQAENYDNSAIALLNAGDSADAKTAIGNLATELITLNNEGDLDIKDANSKAVFDVSVIAVETVLNTVNL